MKDTIQAIKFIAIIVGIAFFGVMLDSVERNHGLGNSIMWSYVLYPAIAILLFGFIFLAIRYSQEKEYSKKMDIENTHLMKELGKRDEEKSGIKRESLKNSVARLHGQRREYEKTKACPPSIE